MRAWYAYETELQCGIAGTSQKHIAQAERDSKGNKMMTL